MQLILKAGALLNPASPELLFVPRVAHLHCGIEFIVDGVQVSISSSYFFTGYNGCVHFCSLKKHSVVVIVCVKWIEILSLLTLPQSHSTQRAVPSSLPKTPYLWDIPGDVWLWKHRAVIVLIQNGD